MQPGAPGSAASVYATAEEVAEAIQSLSEPDYGRLLAAAAIKMQGSAYTDPRDLVNDAILSPYRGALGEGGRRWKPGVNFIAFLFNTIKGLASDSRRSAAYRLTESSFGPSREHNKADDDAFESREHGTPSIEEIALAEEREAARRRVMERVQEHFQDDPEVQWIIMGMEEDKSPEEIQELSSMTKIQYETARRRWRRALQKLIPGRRPS